MKGRVFLPLLLLLLLCGCGKSGERRVQLTGESGLYVGCCDAPDVDGLPEGEGLFSCEEGWSYRGSFVQGRFGEGSVTELPVTVHLGGVSTRGLYTGAVEGLLPQGEGILIAGEGRFTGSFSRGEPTEGICEDFPLATVLWEQELTGLYSGHLLASLPQDTQGRFVSEEGGRSVSFEGQWEGGNIVGEGQLSYGGCTVQTASGSVRGSYTGSTWDALPQGQGEFTSRNGEDIDYTYRGEWRGGRWHGQGVLHYDSQLYYDRVGTFTEGRFTPTPRDILTSLGTANILFTVSDATWDFLEDFPEVFDASAQLPAYASCPYRAYWNPDASYASFASDPESWEGVWMYFYNRIILYRWQEDAFGEEAQVRCLLGCSPAYDEMVLAIVFGNVPSVDTAPAFNAYGVPLGMSTYTNVNGDEIPVLVMVAGAMTAF